ncbi:hypothetical protein ALI22I_01430 [Saccharothrix sp. ALI-22-I]|uniref:serine/threonine protein kinase n=1 Tax=Saccharothrix sp. ALI-22-I TaxID=1933778 RepID=UPI00097CA378|nr:serine/threonine-protein kinase [Saccharothrix sp. ALI-22-I]ONI92866.1 hypothetical protein ALI22I_01430 [Saccharothrix sp. ALI-22-I]
MSGEWTPLGAGPVATVYAAVHQGEPVVLKVYPKALDKRTLAVVGRQHTLLRSLPSVLPVDGVDALPDGRHALRMTRCSQSLADLVGRTGPLSAADVVVLGRAAALALAAAHDAGIVHGGVTPHNVLFRPSGEPVLADFGVVLRQAFSRDPLHAVEFQAPESLRGDTLDERTDLYGLGAVLHFALTGRSPHPGRLGEQPEERVLRVLKEPVPAIARPDVPVALATAVARLLAVDPRRRPADAAAVVDLLGTALPSVRAREDFDDFAADQPDDFTAHHPPTIEPDFAPAQPPPHSPPPAAPQPKRRIRPEVLVGGAVLAAALVLAPVVLLRTNPEELTTTPKPVGSAIDTSTEPGPAVQLELGEPVDQGNQVELAWHSGRALDFAVIVVGEGEERRVLLAERNHTMTVPVDPVRRYCFLVQATDGSRVYESDPKPIREAVCQK